MTQYNMYSNNNSSTPLGRLFPAMLGSSNSSSSVVSVVPLRFCLPKWTSFWGYLRNVGVFIIVICFIWKQTGSLQEDVNSQNNNHQSSTTALNNNPPKQKKLLSLRLLGERHSGTNWMNDHLEDCFGQDIRVLPRLSAWKHWFQKQEGVPDDAIVVAQFRNVFHWIEAMRLDPYHSPNHFDLDWHDFVTKSWTIPRYGQDVMFEGSNMYNGGGGNDTQTCMTNPAFKPYQVIPCNADGMILYKDRNGKNGRKYRNVTVLYELRNDGSGKPFDNILLLRAAKIRNFLSVADYKRVYGFFPVQYEDMAEHGTAPLIRKLEQALGGGVSARCDPIPGTPITKRPLSKDYVDYMRQHVDWETEALIGYYPDMI